MENSRYPSSANRAALFPPEGQYETSSAVPGQYGPSSSTSQQEPRQISGSQCTLTLGSYFPSEKAPQRIYTDQDFVDIVRLLRGTGRSSWSQIPRIYTMLRLIGQLTAIDLFLDQGLNDMWFPFNASQLPNAMPGFDRDKFIESQDMVMTKCMNLEKGPKKHTLFTRDEQFPLTIGDALGRGGYGSVHEAHSPFSGRTYALKRFRRTKMHAREVQSFMRELGILKRITHHHCVELVASYTDSRNFGILMSPVADYDLLAFYDVAMSDEDNQKMFRTFFGCLANALSFLHDNKIRHRDIKPGNILVKRPSVYLTDFGISLDWEELTRSTTTADCAKTWTYCAPEVADIDSRKRNSSSDIWSLGCVFLEMWTILKGATIHDLRESMRARSGRARYYENCEFSLELVQSLNMNDLHGLDPEVMSWIRSMMVIEPSARTTARDLFLTIAKFGKKGEYQRTEHMFCGDCCMDNAELESSSEPILDDGVWNGEFGDETETPRTCLAVTKPDERLGGFALTRNDAPKLVAVSRALAGGLETLAISSVDAHKGVAGAKQNDEESLKAAEVQNCMEPADHKSNTDGYLQESNAEKASRSRSSKRPIIGPIDSDEKLDVPIRQRTRPSSMAKEETEHDREVSLRREALQAATRNNETWPFTDFQGQRMSCTAEDWESPSRFLKAIQSDTFFMKHLKHIDKAQYLRFKTARVDELFPMMHLLLLNGLAVNSKGYRSHYGETPLHQSVSYLWGGDQKNFTIGKLLVGFGAEVSRVTVKNESCLHIAAYGKDNELLRIILDLDQSMINQLDLGGSTPIMNAAYMGRYALVDMLIKRGADFRYTNREGFTPALRAALEGHVKVLKIFVDNGLDVDEVSSSLPLRTNTRLIHMAAEYGRTNVVEYLLSKGADPTHRVPGKRFGSYTAYDLAKRGGFHEVARILKQAEEEWIQWKQRQGFRRRKI